MTDPTSQLPLALWVPAGGSEWLAIVLSYLLGAGMRFEGTPAMYCADHAGPRFDRYLPMSFALL